MKFADLYILNLLWALIGVFALLAWGISRRKRIMRAFADARMLPSIAPGFNPKQRWIKAGLVVLAFAFAVIALAGPQMGYHWEKINQKGVDIMIALDCSKSMLARDISPSRLERAKREIVDLLRMMHSDRAGLVAFSGTAFLQCPLTLDHEAFYIFLDALEPGYLPIGGTNLDAAIQACYDGFEKESDTQKAIIIITDGEGTEGDTQEAARKMAEAGIKIFTIGVGDLSGAPIPDESGGFKKDASGNIVLSKVNEKGLRELAELSGGTYVRSVAGDMDLDIIYTDKILGGMERKTFESGRKKVWENRFQWFLFPCVLLLLIEMALGLKMKKSSAVQMVLAVFLISVWSDGQAYAKMVSSSVKEGIQAYDEQVYEKAKKHFIDAQLKDPENAALYYDIGAAAYKNKEYEQAVENFLQAAKTEDKTLRNNALYNLANAYYRMGRMDEAVKGYEDLLKEFPDDTQAKENLEFVKKKAEEQQKNQSESDRNNKDQDKKDKQDKNQKDQSNKDQDNKDQDNKDQNQQQNDQEKNKPQDKNKDQNKNSGKQDSREQQDKESPGQPPPPQERGAEQDQQNQPQDQQQAQAGTPDENKESQARQQMEQMLNRLEDKPGQAMMPAAGRQHVEKDW